MNYDLDLYKYYLTALTNLQVGYFSYEITMSLAIITIMGWFLTSEKAKKLICSSKYTITVFIVAISLTAAADFAIVYILKDMSDHICESVSYFASKYGPPLTDPGMYDYGKLNWLTIGLLYSFHVLLLGTLGFVIIQNKGKEKEEKKYINN